MRFIIFNGTLKPDAESNTSKVVQMLKLAFEKLGQECKVVTLRDLDYERATKDVKDELAPHIIDIFNCDGVIFATPIWWGGHGSALAVREAFSEVGLIVSGSTRWIAKGILKGCNAWKGS